MYIHCVSAQARFASLQLDWATTSGELLGPTTCLPHKDEGIPLSALPKDTQASLPACSPHYSYCAERQVGKL